MFISAEPRISGTLSGKCCPGLIFLRIIFILKVSQADKKKKELFKPLLLILF